ncbi:oligosaccharide flippase family protein [Paenibacillus sp. CN-4]|uniref:putative polysaccharide biosynthesis protein n=1 Tax=Paenibacillus nanchangensis TaxID=3348343 RepID=UPI00397D91B4
MKRPLNKQTFIQGTLILLAAGIVNRMLGFIPRIALPRIIGAEGVGLYQLGYPFFLVLVTLISGGLPLAIAKLVAEAESAGREEDSARILKTGMTISVGLGIVFSAIGLAGSSWVSTRLLTDSRVYYTFIAMIPMLSIIAVSSVYRGYFQGKQNMIPSAVSSVIETLVRIVFMLWFSWLLIPKGLAFGAAGAMLGVAVGELAGMAILLWQYSRFRSAANKPQVPAGGSQAQSGDPASPGLPVSDKEEQPQSAAPRSLIRRLIGISVPVTTGRLIGSFSYLLESVITARSLALAGIATAAATAQYGSLQGMVIPLLLLPGALTSSLAVSLVPSLSEAAARQDMESVHKRMHQALRLALVTGAPFVVLMYILADPLCTLMYGNASTAPMLRLMAPFALFLYVQAPLQAALQAMDKAGRALVNTLVGAVVKIALILLLASQPEYGIYGAIIAIIVNGVLVTILHGWSTVRTLKLRLRPSDLLKTLTAMIIMAAGVKYMYASLPFAGTQWLQFVLASGAGTALYTGIGLLGGLFSLRDFERLPLFRRRR